MSYILDALRKSEHERQMVDGRNVGMLYPVEIKRNRKPWIVPAVLGLGVLIVVAIVWNIWPLSPSSRGSAIVPLPEQETSLHPDMTLLELRPDVVAVQKRPNHVTPNKREISPGDDKSQPLVRHEKGVHKDKKSDSSNEINSSMAASDKAVAETVKPNTKLPVTDSLNDLPALNITGFIHNQASGNLVMINNQLVHEGDEISKGLRIVKILDNSVIFSYKGSEFTR